MRNLASTINDNGLSLGLRGRVVTALATSGEAGVGALFQQLLASQHPDVRHLAALGSGLIQDENAAKDLEGLLYDPAPNVRRAACLALVSINTTISIEMVAGALLHGEEDVRRAAAEALSEHPEEGHPILKEGSEMEDLLVRRAVVYGIARIEEPWARELLEKMQLEDSQWVVRTAAGQAIEDLDKLGHFIPKPLQTPYETPWLITFASEQGMGIAPGEASWDMLKKALKEGNEDQKLAAMEHYQQSPNAAVSVVPDLYNILYGGDHEMREAAYNTLWQVSASGVELDSPTQFGLG
jgi:HEAT repeat protein